MYGARASFFGVLMIALLIDSKSQANMVRTYYWVGDGVVPYLTVECSPHHRLPRSPHVDQQNYD